VYDRVCYLKTAHDVWLKLCNTYEDSSEIKSSRKDTYNRQYQIFAQQPSESLDGSFARFESIMSNLRSCGSLTYSDNEHAKCDRTTSGRGPSPGSLERFSVKREHNQHT
jgi:hypothetical protein